MFKNNLNNIDALVGAVEMPVISTQDVNQMTTEIICGITLSLIIC